MRDPANRDYAEPPSLGLMYQRDKDEPASGCVQSNTDTAKTLLQ